MMSSLARRVSHGAAAIQRVLSWPARAGATRRAMRQLARMSDREFSDIGLVRQDIVDLDALETRRPVRWGGGAARATPTRPTPGCQRDQAERQNSDGRDSQRRPGSRARSQTTESV